jgi:hypothetical protein
MKLIAIAVAAVVLAGCSASNLDYVKPKAEERWKELGFQVVGYQGHQWGGLGLGTAYGGAKVWHELRTIPDNGITYSGYLMRWGDDLEAYGPFARDALKP